MHYENTKAHTTLLCPITLLTANLDPITHHADKLGPITHHRKPLYHPCETLVHLGMQTSCCIFLLIFY